MDSLESITASRNYVCTKVKPASSTISLSITVLFPGTFQEVSRKKLSQQDTEPMILQLCFLEISPEAPDTLKNKTQQEP